MHQPTTEDLLARIETLEGRQRIRTRRRGARIALSVVALASLLAVPIGVFASHSFTDVPNSNTFHTQIGRVKGAGITAGCTATTYCPDANVTRGQMAAFLARTGGRAAKAQAATSLPSGSSGVLLTSVTIKPGDVTGGTANIQIDAAITGYTETVTGCPCTAYYYVTVNGGLVGTIYHFTTIATANYVGSIGVDSTSIATLAAVPTGVTATIGLYGSREFGTPAIGIYADLVASYVPFAGDGGNVTLAAPVAAPRLDPKGALAP
jgi:S-layer homology domain